MKELLVCIPFHYAPDRLKYLSQVLKVFLTDYKDVHIIVDTNVSIKSDALSDPRIEVITHELSHPFHLTWVHRKHFKERIEQFKNFMYIEDDMYLPYENYVSYLEKFKSLWPHYIPSFIRIEQAEGKYYITDLTHSQNIGFAGVLEIEGRQYTNLRNPYHAFWIMPQKELKETMIKDFDRLSESRETAASYPMWELNKIPLVEIIKGSIEFKEGGKKDYYYVSPKCYSLHLPNNYAQSKESSFAKVELNNIFI